MDSAIWLPLTTLALGWAGAQVTDVLRDRRTTDRDRQARRAEMQRTTLLELQDTLLDWSDRALQAWYTALMAREDTLEPDARRTAADEAGIRLVNACAKVQLLASRVEDEQARELVADLLGDAPKVHGKDGETADQAIKRISDGYASAIRRIGELLRERY
jgi:hypothetical protein